MENAEQPKPKPKPKSQIPKLKILQLSQMNFAAIGISRNLVDELYPFNEKVSLGFLTVVLSIIFDLMYTIREAETFAEYNQSVYMSSLAITIIFALAIILLNVTKLFTLIEKFENLSNSSK